MNSIVLVIIGIFIPVFAYRIYGSFIAAKVQALDSYRLNKEYRRAGKIAVENVRGFNIEL